jgi:HK97 family phage major capsid protein/HK97 family phage prohead protease
MTNRAYSLLTVKAVEEDKRVIRGVATTPGVDRVGDIVEPLGVTFKNPMPLLWQHQHDKPIGTVKFDKPTKDGITFTAEFPEIKEAGTLRDRIEEAWQSIKAGLVSAVSIGFRPIEYAFMDEGGIRFLKTEVYELSAVTIPANAQALITGTKSLNAEAVAKIKSFDTNAPAATGEIERPTKAAPGASGKSTSVNLRPKEATTMKTIAEQIDALETNRATKATRMGEIMQKGGEEGRTTDTAEQEEFDTLSGELDAIDGDLKRLRALEKAQAVTARPVNAATTQAAAAEVRTVGAVTVKANVPKGTAFTRYAMSLMASKGNLMQAAEIAKRWDDQTPEVSAVLKAAVAAGTTTDTNWAKPLVEYQNMASEFAELLRPQTIIGRIPGLRNVPFNIKVPRQTAGSSASWVGEGKPKPVSALAFDQITLGSTKLAGIVVMTEELVRYSNPAAEGIVRQDLIDTIVQTMDRDFVDPANAGSANVKPASITYGVTPVVASGTDADAVRADVQALMAKFVAANMSLAGAVWIMTETQALGLALMLNPLGQPEFQGLAINGTSGGTFFGLPVVLSENIPANAGSGDPLVGAGARIILAKASEIMVADDGETLLDASNQASLEMDSAPTNPVTGSTVLVSLWQHNMVGIRAERFINWTKRRSGAVQFIDSAAYATG